MSKIKSHIYDSLRQSKHKTKHSTSQIFPSKRVKSFHNINTRFTTWIRWARVVNLIKTNTSVRNWRNHIYVGLCVSNRCDHTTDCNGTSETAVLGLTYIEQMQNVNQTNQKYPKMKWCQKFYLGFLLKIF
jgi:hypothetical protein